MREDGTAEPDGDDDRADEGLPATSSIDGAVGEELTRLRGEIEQLSVAVATLQEADEEREQRLSDLETRVEDYQRRGEREREQLAAQTLADFADRMLSVKDSLDNVLGMADLDEDTDRQLSLVRKQFEQSFTGGEVERIRSDGQFDASRHKMVERVPADDRDDGEIVRELDAGYALGDRVLRPARVVVAKGDGS
ncbi:nucleotide exchange factor GrpE [Halorientalis salina]|uniref:nucleotide exchange factor GrpE n=1 Tax=Halorientalis salina TaxID=2932266 RepID=UPI0010AD9036|nr:nucleotide exchange factor GrpE [Halorientalis salina]